MDPCANSFAPGGKDPRMPTQPTQAAQQGRSHVPSTGFNPGVNSGYPFMQQLNLSSTQSTQAQRPSLSESFFTGNPSFELNPFQASSASQTMLSSSNARQPVSANQGYNYRPMPLQLRQPVSANQGYNYHPKPLQLLAGSGSHGAMSSAVAPSRSVKYSPGPLNPSTVKTHLKSPLFTPNTPTTKKKSVKHLDCWFWHLNKCKFTEEECKYSHKPTGILADEPVRTGPGPARAGKNLNRHRNVNVKGNVGAQQSRLASQTPVVSPEAVDNLKLAIRGMGLMMEETVHVTLTNAIMELNAMKHQDTVYPQQLTAYKAQLDQMQANLSNAAHRLLRASKKAKRDVEAAGFLDVTIDPPMP